MTRNEWNEYLVWLNVYEGDDGGESGGKPPTIKEIEENGIKYVEINGARYLSQDAFNSALARDKRKHQDQTKKALDELNALREKANMTQQERDELDARIEDLQSQLRTKEEQEKYEREKLTKEWKTEREKLSQERDEAVNRWQTSTVQRAISDASIEFKAFSAEPIQAMLAPNTRLVEEVGEDGKPTGRYTPKVKYTDVNKEGKPVTLDLTVPEAVKRMKESDRYAYLFQGEGTGGAGGSNRGGGSSGNVDIAKLARENPAEYRRLRAEGKIQLK